MSESLDDLLRRNSRVQDEDLRSPQPGREHGCCLAPSANRNECPGDPCSPPVKKGVGESSRPWQLRWSYPIGAGGPPTFARWGWSRTRQTDDTPA